MAACLANFTFCQARDVQPEPDPRCSSVRVRACERGLGQLAGRTDTKTICYHYELTQLAARRDDQKQKDVALPSFIGALIPAS